MIVSVYMGKVSIVVALLLVLVLWFFYRNYNSYNEPLPTFTVTMTDEGFSPDFITVPEGTSVIWINEGENPHWPATNFHPTHGIYPEFDPLKGITPGEKWSFVLKAGKWNFHDHLYPSFTGVIEVKKR